MTLVSEGMPTEQAAAVCLDVGSTWTKAALVRPDGTLAGFAEHPTTAADVLTGMDAAVRAVAAAAPVGAAGEPELLACSSAGGGLRLAVVGAETLTSTEAGHRVACSSGAHVVHVHAGPLEPADVRLLRSARPGVVLLFGGADGDDPAGLLHNAGRLARARIRYPVLLAGNAEARADAEALLRATGRTVLACDNVTPRRGEMVPGPARAVLVELYERHVLGGRGPAVAPRFRRLVRAPTPDAVARAARRAGAHPPRARCWWSTSARRPPTCTRSRAGSPGARSRATSGCARPPAACWWRGRPRGVVDPVEADLLGPTVARLTAETGYLAKDPGSAAEDRRIAALASLIAVAPAPAGAPRCRPRPRAGRADRRRVPAAGHRRRARVGGVDAELRPGARADPGRRADAGRRRLRGRAGRPAGRPPAARTRPRRCCATTCSADPLRPGCRRSS